MSQDGDDRCGRSDRSEQHLLTEVADTGHIRDDIVPEELASYCLYALAEASSLPSEAAVRRLATVTLAGLRPPH